MAITPETMRLVERLRSQVDQLADGVTRQLTGAWVRAWEELVDAFLAAVDELIAAAEGGRWPTRMQIARSVRLQAALEAAERSLRRLAATVEREIGDAVSEAVQLGAHGQAQIIGSQVPPVAGSLADLAMRFDRVSAMTLDWIVARTSQHIHARTWPLATDAVEAMKRSLVRGVAVGDNPRTAARDMVKRVEGDFNGGLTRAAVIARTEILDAHRSAAKSSQDANSDVLGGWVWSARLDTRTCPSCWAMHGTVHPLSEPGPLDHQQGRCSRTPKTKTWRELGFDIDEPADVILDARSIFDSLPEADRLQIMGARRLSMLDAGEIDWPDLPVRKENPEWRTSYHVRPVRDLQRIADQRAA